MSGPLNDLSLDELRLLSRRLIAVASAGEDLHANGLEPRFDLTPGMAIRITLGAVMPLASRPEFGAWLTSQSTEAASGTDAEPVDAPLACGDKAEGAPIPAGPSRAAEVALPPKAAASDVVQAGSGGGERHGSGSRPSAATHQDKMLPATWTAEEDARLIEIVVTSVHTGETKKTAIAKAAGELGRPEAGTAFRAHHKLKARIDAALTAAAMEQAQTEAPALPAVVEGDSPAIQADVPMGHMLGMDLTTHLLGLTDKGGWSLQRDIDLMELSIAGWPAGNIALELRMQATAIKPRFDALTGLHDDEATGKKVRRWTREQVLDGLHSLAKARAA